MIDKRGYFEVPELCEEHALQAVLSEGPTGRWRVLMVLVQKALLWRALASDSLAAQAVPPGEMEPDVARAFELLMAHGCLGCLLGAEQMELAVQEAIVELAMAKQGLAAAAPWNTRAAREAMDR